MNPENVRGQSFSVKPEFHDKMEAFITSHNGEFQWYAERYEPSMSKEDRRVIRVEFLKEEDFNRFIEVFQKSGWL